VQFVLRVRAPFAAYRPMQAGAYRATLPVMPPSAAYGLLMNLAGIETRLPGEGVTTLMRSELPPVRLAIGVLYQATVATLYQQLHTYPVGSSGEELRDRTRGAKYWITPVRREILVGLDVLIAVDTTDETLRMRVEGGIEGRLSGSRYGLPFAGDNSFLFDDVLLVVGSFAARWYERVEESAGPRRGACRLTVGIDRGDSSLTTTVLVAPSEASSKDPPDGAWVWTPGAPA
jgi:CRISPR-associated protein Cas5t